ncbi:hypothetical protein QVD17_17943 [Tagetes erecta]|uniref:Uncharacterized protein n=1 Tax=Tagetes erecta TaxID=13708 RepID=A0AAD8NVN5_TARER|nr:hypothetical protein QVD17_17943 [Tagetes erecta]
MVIANGIHSIEELVVNSFVKNINFFQHCWGFQFLAPILTERPDTDSIHENSLTSYRFAHTQTQTQRE